MTTGEQGALVVFEKRRGILDKPVRYYLVKTRKYTILVDAGPWEYPEEEALKADYVILTHHHWDHALGVVGLAERGVPICASENLRELVDPSSLEKRMATVLEALGVRPIGEIGRATTWFKEAYTLIWRALEKAEIYSIEDCPPVLEGISSIIECPGHSPDHSCIIIGSSIFIGDNIVAGDSVLVTDLDSYLKTLTKILSDPTWSRAYPSHGSYGLKRAELASEINSTIKRKMLRLNSIIANLIHNEWIGFDSLLESVYGKMDIIGKYIAARSLIGYIVFLERTGLIEINKHDSPWRLRLRSRG